MAHPYTRLLADLLEFVRDEQTAGHRKLLDIWERPLTEKLEKGWSQGFTRLEPGDEPATAWAYLDDTESRFREGDLLVLHGGGPFEDQLGRGLSLESEEDGRWLLSGMRITAALHLYAGGPCYADPDTIDLTHYYERALEEIATSQIGRGVVLPLLSGQLEISFDDRDVSEAERIASACGFNATQAQAIGLAYGAEQIACIQGPPGSGKTRVLALIARLMVGRGERLLVTSHTHMAINNALNMVHAQGVPTVKIGRQAQRKGLDDGVPCYPDMGAWEERPTDGYVVGATPFATCNARLENYEFDTIVFDEASQITVPLALMAMRKGKRFIFIGDQQQLPPVMLSRSVLSKESSSVFAALTSPNADHSVMLNRTYRMNRWLAEWPSQTYYDRQLIATGGNRERRLVLSHVPARLAAVFDPAHSGIFIPTLDRAARTRNFRDADLVAELCEAAVNGGLALERIGIVTPYRAQGRAIRNALIARFGRATARKVVADTVERMQGQERELIILSQATGDEVFLGAVAPFFFQPQRLNVSITRAMTKLIVVGPTVSTLPEFEDETLKRWIAQYMSFIAQLLRIDL